ncbi:MAG: anaerobic ribonucleoside triphosphate reductase [Coriobacteriales bacterium]|nr:anaerobic ribonucleoside triphosphate reductase [Coriobacteriales bacterium]
MSVKEIVKRDGRKVEFDAQKIVNAIDKAFIASGAMQDESVSKQIADQVVEKIENGAIEGIPTVESIQDLVEDTLIENGFKQTSKAYIIYRNERNRERDKNTRLMQTLNEITFSKAHDSDVMRENANIDADTAMGTMLKYGSESAKAFYEMYVLNPKHAQAHKEGDIHIHDLDFYTLTTTCCQIDIIKLFKGGFSTGHGVLREPNDISSYAALCCIAIQSNQNDQHGGQSIDNFDYGMAKGVEKTFRHNYANSLCTAFELVCEIFDEDEIRACVARAEEACGFFAKISTDPSYFAAEAQEFKDAFYLADDVIEKIQTYAHKAALKATERTTFQAMEAFIHNLNTMHSRAGAQTPFSSINYGMDTSPEGRMVMKNLLLATEDGLGGGETPIFPIQIFRVKEGVNANPSDPNHDLFKLACRCSAKRLFPNFSFLDAPYNADFYKGTPETEISYMGCRTRVATNVHDPSKAISNGRGNLSFTSINLPRLGIKAKHDLDLFFEMLESKMELVCDQLLERLEVQSHKKVYNSPFLMGQGVWMDSENLNWDDEQREVLKHGTLTCGFIGLAECLVALIGQHHAESEKAQNLGLEIVGFMRNFIDKKAQEYKLNFSLIATPAEGLSGRFVSIDKEKYGVIPGVTDREYYTNSFHVPVYFPISAFEKINIEAPYHALTNGGHISYVELDGDPTKNLDAFEAIIMHMKEKGIGYGSVNHPVDRDPVCGFNGIIGDRCPKCGREEGDQPFERIRRITGYLVGTLDRFNNGKRAEERDRVKHNVEIPKETVCVDVECKTQNQSSKSIDTNFNTSTKSTTSTNPIVDDKEEE